MNHICLLNTCKGLKDFHEGITSNQGGGRVVEYFYFCLNEKGLCSEGV